MKLNNALTMRILMFMLAGAISGLLIKISSQFGVSSNFAEHALVVGGHIFISLMEVLVVPVVFVSIVCTICSIDKYQIVSKAIIKSFKWFVVTTICASLVAIFIASFFNVGSVLYLDAANGAALNASNNISMWQLIDHIIPHNPVQAIAEANMLQIAMLSVLFGIAISASGEHGKRIAAFFSDLNVVGIRSVALIMRLAPFGVFCLTAILFASYGVKLFLSMLEYFTVVLGVLSLYVVVMYGVILRLSGLSPKIFFQKIYSTMLFAFGVSSSNASTPILLDTVENKLGVSRSVASLVVPFCANINKNGTVIMQVIATIFIANIYHIPISLAGYVLLTMMVMFMSLGTSGAPGIGLITLIMVLKQMGLPIEGIALVIGVERLLDMARSSVNVAGNAMVACIIGKSSKQLDQSVYNSFNAGNSLS